MLKHEEKRPPVADNRPEQGNSEEFVNSSRRKALKTIAAGTAVAGGLALSGKWSKPVVDTIILPAHAQATNPVGPVTTTPEPTTTSGECSPMVENACYEHILSGQSDYISSITVTGWVRPAQAGVAITIQINAVVGFAGGEQKTDILHTTTDDTGRFSATQTYTDADMIDRPGISSANGPCNGVEVVGECGG